MIGDFFTSLVFFPVINLLTKNTLFTVTVLFSLTTASYANNYSDKNQHDAKRKYSFFISAPSISEALLQFSEQTNIQLAMQAEDKKLNKIKIIQGIYTLRHVLIEILQNSGLEFEFTASDTVIVRKKTSLHITNNITQTTEPSGTMALEEILISAQKRKERIQDVPLHVQVFSEETIDYAHITRVEDISTLALSVTFTQRRGFDQSSFRIRGIGTQVLGAGVEPSVATIIDGVVMARGGSLLNELPDVEHIEVLNGPQATLFGKNTSVGLINIVTKRPNTEKQETSVNSQLTSDKDYNAKFNISAPMSDVLSYRVSSFWRHWDGNVMNVVTNNNVNGLNAFGIRGKLQWDPTDTLDVLISTDYSRQVTQCCARITRVDRLGLVVAPSFVNDPSPGGSIEDVLGISIGNENDRIVQNIDPVQDSINRGASVEINVALEDYTITSITSYREWEAQNSWDNDLLPILFHQRQASNRDTNWLTHETRLTSPAKQTLDYILGLYYYTAVTDAIELADRTYVNVNIDEVIFVNSETDYDNWAVFGHLNWHVTQRMTLFGGFRLLNDKISATASRGGQGLDSNGSLLIDFTTEEVSNNEDETVLVGKIGTQFRLTNNMNMYFSGSTGYKGQSFSVEFGFDPVAFTTREPVASEHSTSYEVGLKGIVFDQRLQMSLIGYYTSIDDLQIGLRDLNTISNTLGSVPKTVTQGVEFSFTSLPLNSLIISGGIGYNQAFFADFTNGLCYLGQTVAQGCVNNVQDLTNHTLENAPEWRTILSSRYEYPLASKDLKGFIQGNYRWQSEVFLSDDGDPDSLQKSFGILDLSLGIASAKNRYQISLFMKNVFDTPYVSGVSANGADGGGVLVHTLPRDFRRFTGISIRYHSDR